MSDEMLSRRVPLFLLLAVLLTLSHQSPWKPMGTYDYIVQEAYPCDDQGTNEAKVALTMNRKPDRSQRSFVFSGRVTFTAFLNDTLLKMETYKKTSGWALYNNMSVPFCDLSTMAPSSYTEVMKFMNLPTTCPPPPGDYSVSDIEPEHVEFPQKVLEYGTYKMIVSLVHNGEVNGCVVMIVDVVEK